MYYKDKSKKLNTATFSRPKIELTLDKGSLMPVTALIDTGASRTLISECVAVKTLKQLGQKLIFKKPDTCLLSITGDLMQVIGEIDFYVKNVGTVTFLIVKQMSHDVVIGIDEL